MTSNAANNSRTRMTRRRFLAAGASCAAGALGLGGYSLAYEPRWPKLERPTIRLDKLPAAFDGFTMAQLSDLHRSEVVSVGYIERCIATALALKPDMILLTGDFVTHKAAYVHSIGPALKQLAERVRTFAVLGNHDHWTGASTIEARLEDCGVEMMSNRAVRIERGGAGLWLVGIDDFMVGADDLPKALRAATSPGVRVLMAHNPDSIDDVAAAGVDLMICGHTHGGQVALPFIGPLIVPSIHGSKYAAGHYRVRGTQLYVNRGVGLISPPVRFGVRPEITLLTLRGAAPCS